MAVVTYEEAMQAWREGRAIDDPWVSDGRPLMSDRLVDEIQILQCRTCSHFGGLKNFITAKGKKYKLPYCKTMDLYMTTIYGNPCKGYARESEAPNEK
jgi:hypothetical protein